METIPFSYAYAYVASLPVYTVHVYACAYVYVAV